MTSDEIAREFASRLPSGGFLTVKQTNWLINTFRAEVLKARKSAPANDANGVFVLDGVPYYWDLHRSALNGAGNFRVTRGQSDEEHAAAQYAAHQARQAEIAQLRASLAALETMDNVGVFAEQFRARIKALESGQ